MTAPVLDSRKLKKRKSAVVYPESDGKPMAETDWHLNVMMYLILSLDYYFAQRPEVYVSGNNFIYYEEGNPRARVAPDVYVILAAGRRDRNSYKVWEEEGLLPDVVFEITSGKTRREDTDTKLPLYEREWRVPEYFLFDPTGDYLRPRLQGHRLVGDHYVAMQLADGRLHSTVLSLDLVPEGDALRLYDPVLGRDLPTLMEEYVRAERLQTRAEQERIRAEQAEATAARLAARLRALGESIEEL